MNKKGISPLVATLLLISFAVALGIVIMNFGRAEVENESQCAINPGLKFSVIEETKQLCYNNQEKNILFTIENGPNIKIQGAVVNVIGTKSAENFELSDALIPKAGSYVGVIPYDIKNSGEIRQIKIIPKVILFDEEIICTEKSLTAEEINPC